MECLRTMSKSKKNSSAKEKQEILARIVVEHTETAFHISSDNDDGGHHFTVYLPDEPRDEFDIKLFRDTATRELGRKRVLMCFVPQDYIENFLKSR